MFLYHRFRKIGEVVMDGNLLPTQRNNTIFCPMTLFYLIILKNYL